MYGLGTQFRAGMVFINNVMDAAAQPQEFASAPAAVNVNLIKPNYVKSISQIDYIVPSFRE